MKKFCQNLNKFKNLNVRLVKKNIDTRNFNKQSTIKKTTQGFPFIIKRFYVDKIVKVPQMGDSITEGTLLEWNKNVGDQVSEDDIVCQIETDKVTVEVRTPVKGVLKSTLSTEKSTVNVGDDLFIVDEGATATSTTKTEEKPKPVEEKKLVEEKPKEEVKEKPKEEVKEKPKPVVEKSKPVVEEKKTTIVVEEKRSTLEGEKRVPMTRIRKRIAQRLKDSQNTYAMLTTFNEVDMTNIMELRNKHKDEFFEKHGVKLGFMSAFAKASACILQDIPAVNAVIDGDDIVYRDYVDISVAVSTPKGLVVPVIRNCHKKSFAEIEKSILDLALKARNNKLEISDMEGGTFTISNGGVFGSMMGTPIINPPQSSILGMHAIKDRPYVVNGQILIRPIMYLALTYDHRLIDGREAATFLVKVKDLIENPEKLLLQ